MLRSVVRPAAVVACSIAILCAVPPSRARRRWMLPSIRARTRPSRPSPFSRTGRSSSAAASPDSAVGRHDAAQPHRAAQRRRHGGPDLQSGREQHCPRGGGAAGREDPHRRQLHLGRRRNRLDDAAQHIARLNADGTVDTGFNPGANGNVYALAVQPDGKILVGGEFSTMGGGGTARRTRDRLARLNADGSLDSFNPGVSKTGRADRLHHGAAAGWKSRGRRLLQRARRRDRHDGAQLHRADQRRRHGRHGFNPGANSISGVNALALQADGKILVGGTFTGLGNGPARHCAEHRPAQHRRHGRPQLQSRRGIPGPHAGGAGRRKDPRRRVIQVAGRRGRTPAGRCAITSGGSTPNGIVDAHLRPGREQRRQRRGDAGRRGDLAAGIFSRGRRQRHGAGAERARNRIARITTTERGDANADPHRRRDDRDLDAQRRGPEVSLVTFEFSFDGSFYSLLGNGTRIAGGWQWHQREHAGQPGPCRSVRGDTTGPGIRTDPARSSNRSSSSAPRLSRLPTSSI